MLCPEEGPQIRFVAGEALERSAPGWSWVYHERPAYSVVVICFEVGVVPVESVLVFQWEAVGEIPSGWYDVLQASKYWTVCIGLMFGWLTCVTPGTPSM